MQSIEELKRGDLQVFNQIYTEYHHRLYLFIKKKTKSDFLAEEVVQLTFIKLWKVRENLRPETDIVKQIFYMARQVMIDELRKEAVRHKHEGMGASTPFTDHLINNIEAKDLQRILEVELSDLPPMRRLIFSLSRERGMSHREIADMMGISVKTVENHIAKVLSHLKQYMYTIFL